MFRLVVYYILFIYFQIRDHVLEFVYRMLNARIDTLHFISRNHRKYIHLGYNNNNNNKVSP